MEAGTPFDNDQASRFGFEPPPTKRQKAARQAALTKKKRRQDALQAKEVTPEQHVENVDHEMVSMTKEALEALMEDATRKGVEQGVEQEQEHQRAEQISRSTCGICHGFYVRPKVLPCGHLACEPCIRNLQGSGHTYISCFCCKKQLWNNKSTVEEFANSLPNAIDAANTVRALMDKNTDPHDEVQIFGISLGSLSRTEFERFCKTLENPANKVACGPSVVKAICEVKRFNEALTILSTITSTYDDVLRAALDKLSSLTEHDGVMSPFVAEEIREHLLKLHNSFEDRLHEVYHRAPLEAQD